MKLLMPILGLFLSLNAWGVVQLDPPADLVKKAATGRIELREVIMDLQLNAPEFTAPQQLDPYFNILPDLAKLANDFDLDEIFPEAVKKLGVRLAANGIRWLDISKDPFDKVQYYHSWMDEEVALRFQAQVDDLLLTQTDPARLRTAVDNIVNLIPVVEGLFPKSLVLANTYRRLSSETALKIIRDQNLQEDEVVFWLSKVTMPTAYADYFDFIRGEILGLQANQNQSAYFILKRLLAISRQIQNNQQRSPGWIRDSFGDLILETLARFHQLRLALTLDQYGDLLECMEPQHLKALSQYFQSIETLPNLEYSRSYLQYLQILVNELRSRGSSWEAEALVRYTNHISGPLMVKMGNLEGSYKLKDAKGRDWILSIAIARDNMLVASLGTADWNIYKSYFTGYYNFDEKKFVASLREADTESEVNPVIKFFVNKNNQIEVEDQFTRGPTNFLVGTRYETYPTYEEHRGDLNGTIDGTYHGTIYFPKNISSNVRLTINGIGGYTMGRLSDGGAFNIDFSMGTPTGESPVYLTSGQLESGTWIQLRFYKSSANEIRGVLIVGGRGRSVQEFRLQK